MAFSIPSKPDFQRGIFLEVISAPKNSAENTFNSSLLIKTNGHDNHTLTLDLKIFLRPVSAHGVKNLPYVDASNHLFFINDWKPHEWALFQRAFHNETLFWNDRFWLIPPDSFSSLDVKIGARTVRPNIYCHLFVEILSSAAGAHETIDVVNLDKITAAAITGVRVRDLDSATFQSDSRQYDSLDLKPRYDWVPDDAGHFHRLKHLTIVHEIGHALGLPHIGVSHHDPLCEVALALLKTPGVNLGTPAMANFAGGTNSDVCTGTLAPPSRAANVMAHGLEFDETNAQPWRDRIALHTGTQAANWKVSMHRKAPKFI
jgi:hypothetical protein